LGLPIQLKIHNTLNSIISLLQVNTIIARRWDCFSNNEQIAPSSLSQTMKRLPQGLYEQVMNQYLQNLQRTDQQYDTISIRESKDIPSLLAHYLAPVLIKSLKILEEKHEPVKDQIDRCNEIVNQLSIWTGEEYLNKCKVSPEGEILLSVTDIRGDDKRPSSLLRPISSLSQSSLFTGSHNEPSLLQELKAEIASADRIDMLVSFIKWSGIRLLMDELSNFCNHGNFGSSLLLTSGQLISRLLSSFQPSQIPRFVSPMTSRGPDYTRRHIISVANLGFHQPMSALLISQILQ
jgi:hypothetical protein